jgi:HAE1 family hydrophobic/amphiphilic exporter-1
MNISEIFIRRPVATILLMLAVLIGGVWAYPQLPVAALPRADLPTITVSAQLSGASPQTMASSVATPLIKQFETISGIDEISASSSIGSTQITIQFSLARDIDAAAADVQAAIARASRQLPLSMTTPPSYRKANPADAPILVLALTGEGAPLTEMDDIANNVISPTLSIVDGVAQAQVYGSKTYAVRIEVDPDKLDSRGLTLNDLANTVAAENDQTPVGSMQNSSQSMAINIATQRSNAAQFRTLIIAQPGGRLVRLSDVANVIDSVAVVNQGSWFDGRPAISIAIQRQPSANTVTVADAVLAKVRQIQANLPEDMHLNIVSNSSVSIRAAVSDVQMTLMATIGLVILVVFLFLRRLSATLIPALAIPLSLIATLGMMFALGYSVDNISLLGLTLSVGLVVDDAIVVLENIIRKIEDGMSPLEAAVSGSSEVTGAIVSMSLSLVAVFLPILFMGGVIGRILSEFGVVVTLAILASALVSLTVTPMLAARLAAHQSSGDATPTAFDTVTDAYGRAVGWCLAHSGVVLVVFSVTFVASIWLFMTLPRGLFPQEDIGILSVSTQAREDISYHAMSELQAAAAQIALLNPAVEHVSSSLGAGAPNSGSLLIRLKSRSARPSLDATLADLRKSLANVAGLTVFISPVQSLQLSGRATQSLYQIVLQSIDADETRQWSASLQQAMDRDRSHFTDVATDLQNKAVQAHIEIDNERSENLGVTSRAIRKTLEAAFGSMVVAQIQKTGNNYNVVMEYDQALDWNELSLQSIRVPSVSGKLIPLASFARVVRQPDLVTINQTGQLVAVTLSFNLPAGTSLGEATARIAALKTEIGMPSSVTTRYAGAALTFQKSSQNTSLMIAGAVLVIYLVLGIFYESFTHPLTILSGLPSAALGALLALKLCGFDLSVIALIGLLMLIGIVKKNAIMMIDVALTLRREHGRSDSDAIHEAAIRRFRPIMMTTFCALLAAVPLALGSGASSELRQPLGVAVVGGLVVSQTLTLFITPVIFVLIEKMSRLGARAWTSRPRRAARPGS